MPNYAGSAQSVHSLAVCVAATNVWLFVLLFVLLPPTSWSRADAFETHQGLNPTMLEECECGESCSILVVQQLSQNTRTEV